MWHCRCDCGKELDVHSGALLNGSSKSCGCYSRDMASKNMSVKNKKYNTYDLSGDYGVGWTTNTNREFYFDLEDYDKIKDYAWAEHHTSYICTHDKQHKWMLLHKLIMNDLENNYDVDHIKTEHKFDNRKSNLRIATRSENNRNKIMQKIIHLVSLGFIDVLITVNGELILKLTKKELTLEILIILKMQLKQEKKPKKNTLVNGRMTTLKR